MHFSRLIIIGIFTSSLLNKEITSQNGIISPTPLQQEKLCSIN